MTIQLTPPARLCLALSALAVVNVLGFATANASVITMKPLHSVARESHAAACIGEHPAGFGGPAVVDMPRIARLQGVRGETVVRVDLSARGALLQTAVDQSSGNPWLDKAAVAAARSLRYWPEVSACEAVAGSYGVSVKFDDE